MTRAMVKVLPVPVAPRRHATLRASSRRSSTHRAIAEGWSPEGANGETTYELTGELPREGPAPTPLAVRASSAVVPKGSSPAGRAFPEGPDTARQAVVDAANRRRVTDGTRDVAGGAEAHARRDESAEAVRRARRRIPAGGALVPASAPALIPRPDVGADERAER